MRGVLAGVEAQHVLNQPVVVDLVGGQGVVPGNAQDVSHAPERLHAVVQRMVLDVVPGGHEFAQVGGRHLRRAGVAVVAVDLIAAHEQGVEPSRVLDQRPVAEVGRVLVVGLEAEHEVVVAPSPRAARPLVTDLEERVVLRDGVSGGPVAEVDVEQVGVALAHEVESVDAAALAHGKLHRPGHVHAHLRALDDSPGERLGRNSPLPQIVAQGQRRNAVGEPRGLGGHVLVLIVRHRIPGQVAAVFVERSRRPRRVAGRGVRVGVERVRGEGVGFPGGHAQLGAHDAGSLRDADGVDVEPQRAHPLVRERHRGFAHHRVPVTRDAVVVGVGTGLIPAPAHEADQRPVRVSQHRVRHAVGPRRMRTVRSVPGAVGVQLLGRHDVGRDDFVVDHILLHHRVQHRRSVRVRTRHLDRHSQRITLIQTHEINRRRLGQTNAAVRVRRPQGNERCVRINRPRATRIRHRHLQRMIVALHTPTADHEAGTLIARRALPEQHPRTSARARRRRTRSIRIHETCRQNHTDD